MKFHLKIGSILTAAAIILSSYMQANDFIPYEYQPFEYQPITYADNTDCCERQFTVSIDFLLWELRQYNLSVTTLLNLAPGEIVETSILEETVFPDFDYDPGFRLGVYYNLECLCAKVGIIWTRFHTETSLNLDFEPNRTISSPTGGLQTLDTKARYDLDYLDLDFSKQLCLLPCFSITPHVGVRGWWLTKHFDRSGNAFIPLFETNRFFQSTRKERETAWGLEGGLFLKWNMSENLALVGHFGGSVLAWRTKNELEDLTLATNAVGTVVADDTFTINNTIRSGQGTFDYYIGVEYDLCYCGFDVLLKAGWEHLFLTQGFDQIEYNGLTTGLAVSF